MLDIGVALHEPCPLLGRHAGVLGDCRSSRARRPATPARAPRRRVLPASMNMDARPALANTGLGLLVGKPALATQLRTLLLHAKQASAFRLRRAPVGVAWVAREGRAEQLRQHEPPADWTLRPKTALRSPWVAEEPL
jgi:hypothetical protein